MDKFEITSDSLQNPLLAELLHKLADSFGRVGTEFYVIGATARDIILRQLAGTTSGRKTRDLDIAIAIPRWEVFGEIQKQLVADGFEKSRDMYQRFYYKDYELDVVPYGVIAKEDDYIYWPPEEEIAMSVKGFDEVLSEAITVSIDGAYDIKIASLPGLFVLKFNAWVDRGVKTEKDATDMSFIIANYFFANVDRGVHPEVFDWDDFDEYVAGAYWLAWDIAGLLKKPQLQYYRDLIGAELEKAEQSRLLNQILEHDGGLTFEQVVAAWTKIAEVFQKVVEDEDK
jgi:predicted nucleotidyltransferase